MCPWLCRAACGGGYGDGGQHEQSLWGWLAHIPGLNVVVALHPSGCRRADACCSFSDEPVIYLEHKLLADYWLEFLGSGGRKTVSYNVPAAGARGPVPCKWQPIPLGKATVCRQGADITLVSIRG